MTPCAVIRNSEADIAPAVAIVTPNGRARPRVLRPALIWIRLLYT